MLIAFHTKELENIASWYMLMDNTWPALIRFLMLRKDQPNPPFQLILLQSPFMLSSAELNMITVC